MQALGVDLARGFQVPEAVPLWGHEPAGPRGTSTAPQTWKLQVAGGTLREPCN